MDTSSFEFGWPKALDAGEIGSLVSAALFALAAEQIAYSVAFALFGFCALATAALLAFSVTETVGRGRVSTI